MDQYHDKMMLFIYVAILIVLVLIVMSYYNKEGLVAHAYTSGANQRFAGEFSSPSQGDRTTKYNMEIKGTQKMLSQHMVPNISPKKEVSKELQEANKAFYHL
jgi:hypothetical protein